MSPNLPVGCLHALTQIMNTGIKFDIELEAQPVEDANERVEPASGFVGDVQERQHATPRPPAFPSLKSSTGFPLHSKRAVSSGTRLNKKPSSVSQARTPSHPIGNRQADVGPVADASAPNTLAQYGSISNDRKQIHDENEQRLAAMSEDEILEARNEIMSALDPSLLQRLLRKSDIASGSNEAESISDVPQPVTQVTRTSLTAGDSVMIDGGEAEEEHEAVIEQTEPISADTIHFPRAPQPPDLDPSSATFLDDLHSKYFPSLPADVDKLEWMRSSSSSNKNSYDPSQTALKPGDIRFDFKGSLIPPTKALSVPVSEGLHHHGDAPEAAGYTIPELAHLSRSTYAPQRCIASQTLGRILFKLGKGEFGDPGEPGAGTVGAEDTFGELARGLWREVESQHVIPQLIAESEGNGVDGGRHVSAKAYATEAVWLWQRGGGRRWNTS